MKFIRRIIGKALYGIAKAHSYILGGIIYLIESGILLAKSFIRGCAVVISTGGCLAIILLIGPVGNWLMRRPALVAILLIILVFPILGAISSSYLKYFKEISTLYLMNLSNHMIYPDKYNYRTYSYYKEQFQKEEEEKERQRQYRRRQQQQQWEERFRQWQNFGNTGDQYQRAGSSYGGNPFTDFKKKYEESCATLGIPVTTDPNKIKLAYRRKAKVSHPDVNKAPDATQQFQKINEAYEFLNEDNIQRYQKMGQ